MVCMRLRTPRFHFTLALLLVYFLFAPLISTAQQPSSTAERLLFDAANQERKAHGLQPLKWDAALAAAAAHHAKEMAKRGSLSHQFPGEPNFAARATKSGARFISISENVAEAPQASELHPMWMHSSAHRANILDQDMNSIGIGIAERNGTVFAVEDFSKAR